MMGTMADEEGLLRSVALRNAESILAERQRVERELAAEREQLRITLASIGDGVISTDAQGNVTFLNRVAETLTGWTQAEAAGRPLVDIFQIANEQTRRPVENPATHALAEGRIVGLASHTILIARDGTERPIDDSAAPMRDASGALVGAVLVFRDVSERRAADETRARLAAIVESSDDAIVSKTLDGVIRSWNAGAERLFGYTRQEAIGQPITLIIPQERQDEEQAILERLRRGERLDHFETVRVTKDGRRIDVSLTVSPIKDRDGRTIGASKIARDITDRKRLEQELRQRAEELAEAARRKDEFLATLAHELRNPLAPIRTGLELLRMAGNDPAVIEDVRATMEAQARQLVRLVDDLMDVSRITSGKVTLRKERVDLASVVHSAVSVAQPMIDEAGHELTVALPPEPIVLEADPTRLAQILSNLLTNAAKYTEDEGRIRLTAERQGSDAVVVVKDTGIGIPADMLESIFEMFRQVDQSLERSHAGLGIGLTLVKRLAEMHGGSVEARSEGLRKGSEFIVRLPIVSEQVQEPHRGDGAEVAQPGRLRVLVVDDNKDAARMLGMVVQMLGSVVRTAHDGLEALETAAEFHPDVVLMDLGMPRMNGYDAAREMRRQPWCEGTLLVALTGWGQEEDRQRTRQAGFDHHLVKPVEPAALQKLLAEQQPNPLS